MIYNFSYMEYVSNFGFVPLNPNAVGRIAKRYQGLGDDALKASTRKINTNNLRNRAHNNYDWNTTKINQNAIDTGGAIEQSLKQPEKLATNLTSNLKTKNILGQNNPQSNGKSRFSNIARNVIAHPIAAPIVAGGIALGGAYATKPLWDKDNKY